MSLLIYCIMEDGMTRPLPVIRGVNHKPVYPVAGHGLQAMVSRYDQGRGIDLAGLMAFRDVVWACHELATVIPMRFGSVLPDGQGVLSHLMDRRKAYEKLLKHFKGCVEMGIRVLQGEARAPVKGLSGPSDPDSGRSFLISRKACYDSRERSAAEVRELADQCRRQFSGLYKSSKVEHGPVLSLYFLTFKGSVEAFQQTFKGMMSSSADKMLLSGPWPPYNFAADEDLGSVSGSFESQSR